MIDKIPFTNNQFEIVGDRNKYFGEFSFIQGNDNKIEGFFNSIIGDKNIVYNNRNTIIGNKNFCLSFDDEDINILYNEILDPCQNPCKYGNYLTTEKIILKNAGYDSLPDCIGCYKNLIFLDLSNNSFKELPYIIKNLDNDIIEIHLENNQFSDDYKEYIKNELFPIANQNKHLYL